MDLAKKQAALQVAQSDLEDLRREKLYILEKQKQEESKVQETSKP